MKDVKNCFWIGLLGMMVLGGCRRDDDACSDNTNPECENYDPCWNSYPTAEFKMRQTSPGFVVPENLQGEWCDTILGSGVEFLADMSNADSYTWQIGTEAESRTGNRHAISFSSYTQDTSNLNPDNPNYYLPLPITLTVRNMPGACVPPSDTLLSVTRQLVFARKSLTIGTFRGRVEGENFDRDVTLWRSDNDLNHPDFTYWYVSIHLGLPNKDTLRVFHVMAPTLTNEEVSSYKEWRWEQDWQSWNESRDGVRVWNQKIITSSSGADEVELYIERIPENNSGLQTVKFSGIRIE